MEPLSEKRNVCFDFLKVVAIFSVVLGHTLLRSMNNVENYQLGSLIHDIIYSFHMPLFAFISGFFLNTSRSPFLFFTKKWKQLVLPYLSWILLLNIIPEFYHSMSFILDTNEDFHFLSFFRNIFYWISSWGFWFIRDLFLCYCIAYLGRGKLQYLYWLVMAFVMLYINAFIYDEGTVSGEPLAGTSYLFPYFIIGKFYSDFNKNKIKEYNIFIFLSLWFLLFISLRFGMIQFGKFITSALLFMQKISACIGLTLLAGSFFLKYREFQYSILFRKICDIGQYTLGIYILQDYVSSFCFIDFSFGGIYRIIYDVIYSCFILLLCYSLCLLLSRFKYTSFLLGK